MQVTRIIAIRHGETAWNVDTRIQGQLDITLNMTGLMQAGRVAQALADEDIDAIYASDLLRAWQTANAIAHATDSPLSANTGLRERGFGLFEGKTFAEIETLWPEEAQRWRKREPDWAPPGGESLSDMRVCAGAAPPGRADGAGGAWGGNGHALPPRHWPGTSSPTHLASGQCSHQPPAVDPRRLHAGGLGRHHTP